MKHRFLCCALAVLLVGESASVNAAWAVNQTRIKHVQVGNANAFYLTVTGDTTVSGCETNAGWLKFDLSNVGEKEKALMSFALSAQMSGTPVDVGSTRSGCVDGYAHLQFIRVGNFR